MVIKQESRACCCSGWDSCEGSVPLPRVTQAHFCVLCNTLSHRQCKDNMRASHVLLHCASALLLTLFVCGIPHTPIHNAGLQNILHSAAVPPAPAAARQGPLAVAAVASRTRLFEHRLLGRRCTSCGHTLQPQPRSVIANLQGDGQLGMLSRTTEEAGCQQCAMQAAWAARGVSSPPPSRESPPLSGLAPLSPSSPALLSQA